MPRRYVSPFVYETRRSLQPSPCGVGGSDRANAGETTTRAVGGRLPFSVPLFRNVCESGRCTGRRVPLQVGHASISGHRSVPRVVSWQTLPPVVTERLVVRRPGVRVPTEKGNGRARGSRPSARGPTFRVEAGRVPPIGRFGLIFAGYHHVLAANFESRNLMPGNCPALSAFGSVRPSSAPLPVPRATR